MYNIDFSGVFIFAFIGVCALLAIIIAVPVLCWLFIGKAVGITILVFYSLIALMVYFDDKK